MPLRTQPGQTPLGSWRLASVSPSSPLPGLEHLSRATASGIAASLAGEVRRDPGQLQSLCPESVASKPGPHRQHLQGVLPAEAAVATPPPCADVP